jgi:hypothetical protein
MTFLFSNIIADWSYFFGLTSNFLFVYSFTIVIILLSTLLLTGMSIKKGDTTITKKDAPTNKQSNENYTNFKILLFKSSVITLIFAILCRGIYNYQIQENVEIKNLDFSAWVGGWDVKIMASDQNYSSVSIESINWKLDKEIKDTAKYYLAPEGGRDITLIQIKQQTQENKAYLTGKVQRKKDKTNFEFFMSPDKKHFIGWEYSSKTKEPEAIWYATKK